MSAAEETCDSEQPVSPGYWCTKAPGHDGPHAWVNAGVEWPNIDERADAERIAAAIDRLAEQQRIANLCRVVDLGLRGRVVDTADLRGIAGEIVKGLGL